MKVRIYVEGGPQAIDANGLRRFRSGFKRHFERVDPRLEAIEVVAPGSTEQTIKRYAQGLKQYSDHSRVALLVDSDSPVTANSPAEHLRAKLDSAKVPQDARTNIFLMVQCMEAWIVADPEALEGFYKSKFFKKERLPKRPNLEQESKADLYAVLEKETKDSQKGQYGKISHAGKLLVLIDPEKVASRCPRFGIFRAWLNESIDNPPVAA